MAYEPNPASQPAFLSIGAQLCSFVYIVYVYFWATMPELKIRNRDIAHKPKMFTVLPSQ